jgi:hypothetical protein
MVDPVTSATPAVAAPAAISKRALSVRCEVPGGVRVMRNAPPSARCRQVLGITATEYATRFCNTVQTGWRLTCTALRKFETPDP